jgi:trehalose 6-phosphate phosphatase
MHLWRSTTNAQHTPREAHDPLVTLPSQPAVERNMRALANKPMQRILTAKHRVNLSSLRLPHTLLAFDFDGTLAPIVADKSLACMRDATARSFSRLCDMYDCAVISGRSRQDVSERLAGANVVEVIGNHGIEPSERLEEFATVNSLARRSLTDQLAGLSGVEIEDKTFSLAVHYRGAANKLSARSQIIAAVKRVMAEGVAVRYTGGKMVLNVVASAAPHKGVALRAAMSRRGASRAMFVGDDLTDEDVFNLPNSDNVVCIRVGNSKLSHAPYYLRSQQEIDLLLTHLIDLKEKAPQNDSPRRNHR